MSSSQTRRGKGAFRGPRISSAGKWVVAGAMIFIVSRVAIELARLGSATNVDDNRAATRAWVTVLTLCCTLAIGLALIYVSQRSAAVRHRNLQAGRPDVWIYETIRAPEVKSALAAVGAPDAIVGKQQNSYFSIVADMDGIGFWVGSRSPKKEWAIGWESIDGIQSTTVPWVWLTLPAIELDTRIGDRKGRILLPVSDLGWLQPRAVHVDDFDAAVLQLRALWNQYRVRPGQPPSNPSVAQ